MKVLNSEIVKGSRNRRTQRIEGLNGGVITFQSSQQIFKDSIVSLEFNGKNRYYCVAEISTINSELVEVCAVEYGYWANYLTRNKGFDVRSILDLDVSLVTDESIIKQVTNSNSFC